MRYRDLDSGAVARSDAFELEERAVAEGTKLTHARLLLQKPVPNERGALEAEF